IGVHEGTGGPTGVAGVCGEVAAVAEDHVDLGERAGRDLDLGLLLHHRLRDVLHHRAWFASDVRTAPSARLHQTSSAVLFAAPFFTAGMISEPIVSIWFITVA